MRAVTPTAEQQEILDLGLRSIRIRAGAGTGKTTTVALVIGNLVARHGVDPERILGITFTNRAASELADRVRDFLGPGLEEGRQAEVHTYHGFAAQILAEYGALAGVDNRVRIVTPTFSRQILFENFQHTTYRHVDITNPRWVDKIRTLGDRMGDHLQTVDRVLEAADPADPIWAARIEMLETLRHYESDKRRLGVVDYADLVSISTRLLADNPHLAHEIRSRYRVVVLDEYQDTNPAQRALLTTVFSDGFPVIAVGDEDQTIYEWRGASAENFERFSHHFASESDTPVERALTLNRRSAPAVLEVANAIRRQANPTAGELRSHDPDAPGSVITYWAADAIAEADWIADRLELFHEQGVPWSEMAVLFRKNRDFAVVVEAMARHDIPVEVANLGGLLSVPEVAELRAWLTVLDRPENSPALVQILFGSHYRLGMADIAPLARWASDSDQGEDTDDVPPVSLLEALEHVDDIEGVRPEARHVMNRFLDTYREILTASQGASLVETCRLVLDQTRVWQDMEALPPNQRITARLNLYRMLDLAEDWSPLTGRPSLGAFLDYLEAMQDEPAEELDSAHLSGEEAVTLITVHRSKGLEWDVVVVPAVTEQSFPGRAQQFPDPFRFPEYLPVSLRIDDHLSDMPADDKQRTDYFRERNRVQEWRVAYVAATRARSTLVFTGAYWYGLLEPTNRPRQPSELFRLVEEHPVTTVEGHEEEGPRPEVLRATPAGPAPDPLFESGWDDALRRTVEHASLPFELARSRGIEEPFEARVTQWEDTLFDLDGTDATPQETTERDVVSVTGLVVYAQCPKRFYWSEIDPLPRRRNPAAEAGTQLHRRIELHQRGQVPFDEFATDLYDVVEGSADGGEGGFAAYRASRFAAARPLLVEAPFVLALGTGYRVRGRIDAVYADGPRWEIVDFKSGAPSDDPSRIVQLEAYAVAATDVDFGLPAPESIDVTFAYLGGGLTVETTHADREWRDQARARIEGLTTSIERGLFDESPGTWCRHCDFIRFCEPGRAWMLGNEAGRAD